MSGICVNEDNAHFYANHPEEDMTAEGVDALVDYYAQFPDLAALMFCTNVQTALFNSQSWERLYDGYDPELGRDQPVLDWIKERPGGDPELDRELTLGSQGRYWIHNLWLLEHNGVDHPERWLARCREQGIEGWLSMRMNDVHYNANEDAFWHCSLWRERPDLWRVPYDESAEGRGFDYLHPEVREHHLTLIRELLERYDLYGLELDWIRTPPHFAAGGEEEGRGVLTDFVAEVRELADAAAQRLGHPVQVGARVPTRRESGVRMGMDGLTWAREGLVDQLVLSSYLSVIEFDMPVAEWKRELADLPVTLVAQFSTSCFPFPAARQHGLEGLADSTVEYLRGAAAAAFYQGADRVYLFNHCYYEADFARRDKLRRILESIGSPESLAGKVRQHAISYPEITAKNEPDYAVLPVSLADTSQATLEVMVGPAPDMKRAALVLGFDREQDNPLPQDLTVRVNGASCRYFEAGAPAGIPAIAQPRYTFLLPTEAHDEGRYTVEVSCANRMGSIVWCEVYVA